MVYSRSLAAASFAALLACGSFAAGEEGEFRLPRKTPFAGKAPTNFTLPDTSGVEVNLTDFRGATVLLTFWSCYSDSCFTSVSALHDFIREFGTERFVVVTVCSEVPSALATDGYTGLLKHCSAGQVVLIDEDRTVQETYSLESLPVGFLIGPDFVVREVVRRTPRLNEPEFRRKIARLVAASGGDSESP